MDDDGDDKDDSKRTRNLSEKKRRDQFNLLVNELSTMVSTNNRKMDKSTVLKSTISFLRNHNEITVRSRAHDVQEDWKPSFLSNEEFTYLVLEALEGFLMVFSTSGRIYYVSESFASLLGHHPADVVNKNIFDLAYEEDRPPLYDLLQTQAAAAETLQNVVVKEREFRFQCHLKRGSLDFRESISYELVQFNGHFRFNVEQMEGDELSGYQQDPEARVLFVCTGRLHTPHLIRDVSLVDSTRSEFTSRHSLEWKFLFLDHRAPPIIGYLPFEVLGTSGYDYYHFDDLEKVVSCHEALMQKGELTSCYYRFLTKGQQWIWLQTRFYITYHQWNSKPEFVVCTHRVVSYTDISKDMKQEEVVDAEVPADRDANNLMMDDEGVPPMSPSYIAEAPDAFAGGYQPISQPASVKSASASSTSGTVTTVGTVATAGASWPRTSHQHYNAGSDTASLSEDSRSVQHSTSTRESRKTVEPQPIQQQQLSMPPQYLDPSPFVNAMNAVGMDAVNAVGQVATVGAVGTVSAVSMVGTVQRAMGAVSVGGVLQLPLPVIVSPEQAQMQLQRKHEQLQQMIDRQQEELRQVKEQLLLARLGMLPPFINVQSAYMSTEEMQQVGQRLPAQIVYEAPPPRPAITGYPPPPQPPPHPHMPQ